MRPLIIASLFITVYAVASNQVSGASNASLMSEVEIETIVKEAVSRHDQLAKKHEQTVVNGKSLRPRRSSKRARNMLVRNNIINDAIDEVVKQFSLTKQEARNVVLRALENIPKEIGLSIDVDSLNSVCHLSELTCNPNSKFREINGVCNNLDHPYWGASGIPMRRLLHSTYQDGQSVPRGGFKTNELGSLVSGNVCKRKSCKNEQKSRSKHGNKCPSNPKSSLPNPRIVSSRLHPDLDEQDNGLTHMFTQFGQFLDHDITLTPESEFHCCSSDAGHPECFPIQVYGNDSFYGSFGLTCLPLSRSIAFCDGQTSKREQINDITAFVDASNVYGSDVETEQTLRDYEGGRLKTSALFGNELLPVINGDFKAGDSRATEMPGLATMHTLFLREHNRIAEELSKKMNDDELVYQSTRRLVIAEMQNIVFKEYLPLLLGEKSLAIGRPHPVTGRTTYDASIDPSITNSFATAAFRFGHSMIRGLISLIDQNSKHERSFLLRDHFFNMEKYIDGDGEGMERLLNGLMTQPAMANDRFVTSEVTNFLFKESLDQFGSDLVARNIQRGRDHGIPGYNDWREVCGLPRICSWNKIPAEIPEHIWNIFSSVYEHPNDIDLFSAGIAEKPTKKSGIIGPVFNCILSEQFNALRMGDRFFYTHRDQIGSFNDDQLENLSQRTLADIICDNTKLASIKESVFELSSPVKLCKNRNQLKLSLFNWKR